MSKLSYEKGRKVYIIDRGAELKVKSLIGEMIDLRRNKSEIKDALNYFVNKHYDEVKKEKRKNV